MKIILGSQSIYRKKMLEEIGIEFEVITSNIDEKAIRDEDPKKLVLALGRAKAEALKARISEPAILITSDQVVLCEGKILEKPADEKEAAEFLRRYNNSPAETITSVIVTNLANGKRAEEVDVAKIYFNPFSEEEIGEILREKEIYTLAGGFNVDGKKWSHHIKMIEGTRDSVIGMPKEITLRLIKEVM